MAPKLTKKELAEIKAKEKAMEAARERKEQLAELKVPDGHLPVELKKNYRPASTTPKKGELDTPGQKRWKGEFIALPAEEARAVVKAGIADRADEF